MDYRLEQLRFELREDPSSRIFFKLGEHLRREGELEEAIAVLSAGLEHHPTYVAAWVSLGRALLDVGAFREATDALNRAIALDPENAVASRHAGEAAIANGEWVEAIKALKRTRAMTGPDEVLDQRIQFVESHLAEIGQLEAPGERPPATAEAPPAPGRSLDQVFADADDEPAGASSSDDVFVVESPDEAGGDGERPPENNGRATMAVPLSELPLPPDEVVSFADVSIDEDAEETAEPMFEIDADALIDASPEEFGELDADAEAEPVLDEEPVFEIDDESDAASDFGIVGASGAESESDTMPLSVPDLAAPPAEDLEPEVNDDAAVDSHSEELPLPTMTLARLALDQGDLALAEKTLRGVLEREPDHVEAGRLLADLTAGAPADGVEGGAEDEDGDVRAQALRRWLAAVRLASERLKS